MSTDGSMKEVCAALAIKGKMPGALGNGLLALIEYSQQVMNEGTAVEEELAALTASRRIVRPVLEAKMQARLDVLDKNSAGKTQCPDCHARVDSQGRRARRWNSTLGPLHLKRRYSLCGGCGQRVAQSQKALGLSESDFTPRLEEATTMMATTVPFGMATKLVEILCGIEVSVKAVEMMVERRGEEVLSLCDAEAKLISPYDETGLPVAEQLRPGDMVPIKDIPKVAYLEIDGVIPLTRVELNDDELTPQEKRRITRAKKTKARGGKGRRYRIVGREVKNAVLYDGKDCTPLSPGRGCILKKTYVSHLGEWGTFAQLLIVELFRLRFDKSKLLVILSDGAEWIRSLAAWLPFKTLLILDLFHVKKRIWEVAHSLYGEHAAKASQWAHSQCERIEKGHVEKVIEALRFLKVERPETRKLVNELAGYFVNNKDRMDYPSYWARGLRVGSGAVESANFHVTGNRLILQGMRWSADGARIMAVLRADLFNERWESRTRQLLTLAAA